MKWYQKTWAAWFLLILFWPVGVYLTCKYHPTGRKFLAGFFALMIIGVALSDKPNNKGSTSSSTSSVIQSTKNESIEVKSEPAKPLVHETPKIESPAPEPVKTFGITPYEFADRFNQCSQELNSSLGIYIDDFTFESGPVNDVARYKFNDYTESVITIDKNTDRIKNFVMLTSPSNPDALINSLITYALAMTAINPDLDNDQRGNIFKNLDLVYSSPSAYTNLKRTAVNGNSRYMATLSNGVFMFGIEPK
ncbi:MAG: hypothetical protein IJ668_09305 [Selenomonadaceae bacterium]|nr:hypothetical protein [Selenomonadaceae bacterium]